MTNETVICYDCEETCDTHHIVNDCTYCNQCVRIFEKCEWCNEYIVEELESTSMGMLCSCCVELNNLVECPSCEMLAESHDGDVCDSCLLAHAPYSFYGVSR